MDINWSEILVTVLEALGALIITYLLPKLPKATKAFIEWSENKAHAMKHEAAGLVLGRLFRVVGDKVLALENTAIESLKEAAKDGKITKEELPALLAKVKASAIEQVKAEASAGALWEDAKKVFSGSEDALLKWVSGSIETHVATLPASGLQTGEAPAMKSVPVPPPPAPPQNV